MAVAGMQCTKHVIRMGLDGLRQARATVTSLRSPAGKDFHGVGVPLIARSPEEGSLLEVRVVTYGRPGPRRLAPARDPEHEGTALVGAVAPPCLASPRH